MSSATLNPLTQTASWAEIGLQKRQARDKLIPDLWKFDAAKFASSKNVLDVPVTCGILTEREISITSNFDAMDMVAKLRAGNFSAEEVAVAFCKRAAIAQQLTNCLTEIFFEEAITAARNLDRQRKAHPENALGPLWGLPVSLKDTYQVPGVDASIGIACYAFKPSVAYSPLAALLVSLGAVLYCKTNVPQTMMTADSDNNLFGRTLNPVNKSLTAGGSTGGEGALIAMRGSLLGFGTDLAGSVRIPAFCNGIYALKPSSAMIPFSGQTIPFPVGWEGVGIVASAGMIATSLKACSFALETIRKENPAILDPSCLQMRWNDHDEADKKMSAEKLRVGCIVDDGLFTPTVPMRRGLQESIEKLETAGVEVIQIKLPNLEEALSIIGDMFALDGSQHVMGLLDSNNEPLVPSVENMGLLTPGPPKTLAEYYSLTARRRKIEKIYMDLWHDNKLDAIIMLPAPFTAPPLDSWSTASYTAIWNLVDYPAVVIPVGKVGVEDKVDNVANAKYGDGDSKIYKMYTGPEDNVNAPIAVQLIGMKQKDQEFTVVAGVLDSIINPI